MSEFESDFNDVELCTEIAKIKQLMVHSLVMS